MRLFFTPAICLFPENYSPRCLLRVAVVYTHHLSISADWQSSLNYYCPNDNTKTIGFSGCKVSEKQSRTQDRGAIHHFNVTG